MLTTLRLHKLRAATTADAVETNAATASDLRGGAAETETFTSSA